MIEGMRSIPVQQMPDFEAALNNYREILAHAKVDSESIAKNVHAVRANNITRKSGNLFINNVNQVSRRLLPNKF